MKYALIGLAPYSFHYDESKTYVEAWRIFHYYAALKDLHNFWLKADSYRELFRSDFLTRQLSLDDFDLNNVYYEKGFMGAAMNYRNRATARERIDVWAERRFPETRAENVKILEDYLTLCDKCNVRPIIFLPPVSAGYAKYFSRQLIDELRFLVNAALNRHSGAIFFDGWALQEYFSDGDFADVDHLNFQGAAKFSVLFNQLIEGLKR